MENLPIYLPIIFSFTTGLAIWLLYQATNRSKAVALLLVLWLTLQSILALSQFYTVTDAFPPRLIFLILPPLLLIVALFATTKGRQFIDRLDIKLLTLLHVVRIPVELVLFWLALNKVVPTLMTFEGRNFDILAGLTAPLIYYFGFVKNRLDRKIIIVWNCLCLALLLHIVINGILSVPTPFQQFAFDQPNIALLYFPFVLLPGLIVPLVLFSHLASIRQLLKQSRKITINRTSASEEFTAEKLTQRG